MISRFNLTKGTFLPLSQCIKTPQSQLFSDSFRDSYKTSETSVPSKLKLELMKLFPAMIDQRVLELDDVNVTDDVESPQLYTSLLIRCSSIDSKRKYKFIKNQDVYHTKPFNIPKLSSHETISLCDMDKVFVSQLTRCPSVHLNISPPIISVVLSSDRNDIEISSNCEVCSFTLNGAAVE